MAFFKFRKGGDTAAAAPQPESVEALRRRARHRLIGAAVLVLLAVIGFPLLFDTQPRPIAVDIPIEIPDRAKVKPLPAPQPRAQGAVSTPGSAASTARASAAPAVAVSAGTASAAPVAAPAGARTTTATTPVTATPAPAPDAVKPAKVSDNSRAEALLDDTPPSAREAEGRFVVQVGAFSDSAKARETRLRVEKAGLKTYTHVAETKEGRRIRVRVGPFASRAEADKAASRIKELALPASILTL